MVRPARRLPYADLLACPFGRKPQLAPRTHSTGGPPRPSGATFRSDVAGEPAKPGLSRSQAAPMAGYTRCDARPLLAAPRCPPAFAADWAATYASGLAQPLGLLALPAPAF